MIVSNYYLFVHDTANGAGEVASMKMIVWFSALASFLALPFGMCKSIEKELSRAHQEAVQVVTDLDCSPEKKGPVFDAIEQLYAQAKQHSTTVASAESVGVQLVEENNAHKNQIKQCETTIATLQHDGMRYQERIQQLEKIIKEKDVLVERYKKEYQDECKRIQEQINLLSPAESKQSRDGS